MTRAEADRNAAAIVVVVVAAAAVVVRGWMDGWVAAMRPIIWRTIFEHSTVMCVDNDDSFVEEAVSVDNKSTSYT